MIVAGLDLGTNSFLCLIAEVKNGVISQVYFDEVEVVRLGQGVHETKKFNPEALLRAKKCLSRFAEEIKKFKPEKILAMATSAARDVVNADELFKIGKELNIPIEIIPGKKEAEITFCGATADFPKDHKKRMIIDIGGGSTEIIIGEDHKVLFSHSFDIGCVRLTEKYSLNQKNKTDFAQKANLEIKNQLQKFKKEILDFELYETIAVAGTPTALAMIELREFNQQKIEQYILTKEKLKLWYQQALESSPDELIEKWNIEKGRADVILIGIDILNACLDLFQLSQIRVSTKGVRYGVVMEASQR